MLILSMKITISPLNVTLNSNVIFDLSKDCQQGCGFDEMVK
jgi:hypothetical protein